MLRIEALDAERKTVDARRPEAFEFRALERARIGFQRDLGLGDERHTRADPRKQPVDRRRREQARRAAADEDRDDRTAPDRRQRVFEIR